VIPLLYSCCRRCKVVKAIDYSSKKKAQGQEKSLGPDSNTDPAVPLHSLGSIKQLKGKEKKNAARHQLISS
jgi:hypothetical protein